MRKHLSPMMQYAERRAAFRLRQLLSELQLLMGAFPDLRDAFDADELPLAFILRRDSRLTARRALAPYRAVAPRRPGSTRRID